MMFKLPTDYWLRILFQILMTTKVTFGTANNANRTHSINVSYDGKKLTSNTSYFWKVKTWCKYGGESEWSDIQEFLTGNLTTEYQTTRYPLENKEVSPFKIIKKAHNHYLIDFGKVAFGYLALDLESPKPVRNMIVHLAERGNSEGVNTRPGRSVRYYKIKQMLNKGKNHLHYQTSEKSP